MLEKTNLHLKVSTGKQRFLAKYNEIENKLYVETKSNPEKGKANKEILKELKKIFGFEVTLISGFKSKEKIIEISIQKEDLKNILFGLI